MAILRRSEFVARPGAAVTRPHDLSYRAPVPTQRISRRIQAPRSAVYAALLDPRAVAAWRVPDGMTSRVHAFEPREGGVFRVSLTYEAASARGKSAERTDTYRGAFVKLVPDRMVVESLAFETAAPEFAGQMTITTTLTDVAGGTDVSMSFDGLPPGVAPADNERGTRMALAKLAALLEAG
jgi:uncharacterized protein YndB with AHSA1/START domain